MVAKSKMLVVQIKLSQKVCISKFEMKNFSWEENIIFVTPFLGFGVKYQM
jgi:energy-converting hydrogenase Eha subunit A